MAGTCMKILVGGLLSMASVATAEHWHRVTDSSLAGNFIDASSITRQGSLAEYWDKVEFARPQKTSTGLTYRRLSTLGVVNCADRTFASKYYAIYDSLGKVIDFVRGPGSYRHVMPGTKGDRIINFVCTAKGVVSLSSSHTKELSRPFMATLGSPHNFVGGIHRFDPLIDRAAESNHLEKALLQAVITVESGAIIKAVSPAGAAGLMQLMPLTARRFGATDLFDPAQNIEAGAKYLSYLLRIFGNDKELTLAAYNAGEGAVIRYGNRIPPFVETRRYVPKVLSIYNRLARSK